MSLKHNEFSLCDVNYYVCTKSNAGDSSWDYTGISNTCKQVPQVHTAATNVLFPLKKKEKKNIYIYITASLLLHSTDKNCTKEATFMALKKCTKKWRQVHLECPNSSPAHTAICRSLSCYDLNLKRYKKRKKETGGNVKERKTYAWYKNSK